MRTVIDGIQVTATEELSRDELAAYVQRGRDKYGRALLSMDIKLDGEFADVCYRTQKLPFERIRRITGYLVGTLDKWNDGKRSEERDRVKHGLAEHESGNG